MDWKRFNFEYRFKLTNSVVAELVKIEAFKEAALNLVLPSDWKDQLDRLNRIRAVHGTTALEGNPLSEAEVSHQMDLLEQPGPESQGQTREQRQIRNAGRAQEWVRLRFGPEHMPIRLSDILHIHKMLTEESDEVTNVPGQLRTYSVVVGTEELGGVHRGAPPNDVPALMDGFVDFANSRRLREQHPVIRALLAHFFLVTIHPFGDGNGRVSRLVEAGILFQGGYNVLGFYGLSNYFYQHGDEYKKLLQGCRQTQPCDMQAFIAFGLSGFAAELKGINNFIKSKLNRVVYRAMLVRAFNTRIGKRRRIVNQREHNLLDFLLQETEPIDPFSETPSKRIRFSDLRDAPYVKAAYKDVTTRTFFRELVRLADLGFINFKPEPETKEPIFELDFGAIGKY